MDFESLKNTVSNLTLYDLKAGVRKVQNAVMNYTEMEAKVREATNNEPWGASSTLMQEIASATHNYQLLNEIMPMIYKRFTEKAAEEWRQIYKSLQLLEFLVKNGSERVIDDARSHISLLKMLRQFHFIDQNGKDQGINVRNRAKELAELLSDVEKIRAERKKARSNRNKYGGVEGGMSFGAGFSSGGSRYGGFGSEDASYGGYSGGVYGDGGGFSGASGGFSDSQARRDRFEEYDEYDEGAAPPPRPRKESSAASSTQRETKKPEPPKPKAPEVDLFSFDEPISQASNSNGKQPAAANDDFGALQAGDADDDDFDDFQSAAPAAPAIAPAPAASSFSIAPPATTSTTTSSTQFAAPQPRSGAQGASINDLFSSVSPGPANNATSSPAFSSPSLSQPQAQAFKAPVPTNYQASQPNYFTSVPISGNTSTSNTPGGVLTPASTISSSTLGGGAKKAGGDAFSSLLSGTNLAGKAGTPGSQKGMSMADMAKQKASAGMWGAPAASQPSGAAKPAQKTGSAFDDLLG